MKTLIRNGSVVDGTGRAAYRADVLIEGDRIAVVSPDIPTEGADQIVEAEGNVVCPGFIDTHSHSDLRVIDEPDVLPKISQGITTEFLGQDGVAAAPVGGPQKNAWPQNVAGLLGVTKKPWTWESEREYADALRAVHPATNLHHLVPHGNLRLCVMGMEARPAAQDELARMQALLADALDAGCAGMSTGLIYPPCPYAAEEELMALCKVLAQKGKPFVVHQRSEAGTILSSMEELVSLARSTGVKVHISHFKLCGKKNWRYIDDLFRILDGAQKEGLSFSFDQYPYTAGSTMLSVILPPWVHAGGMEQMFARLRDAGQRRKIKEQIMTGIPGWDDFVEFAGLDGIYITDAGQDKEAVGRNLVQLGELRGKDPLDATFDLLLEQSNQVGIIDFYGSEENLTAIMRDKRGNFCTDGLLGGTPHPRVYGTFPRVLGRYVREQKVLTLEQAVHKMTEVPAVRFAVEKRGQLEPGFFADIVVFDPAEVIDAATFENPRQYSRGIRQVFVNGALSYRYGHDGTARSGRVLF